MEETTTATATATHPDVFTTDEAVAYMKFPSRRAFVERCREHGVKGVKVGGDYQYAREQLELLRRLMFGLDVAGHATAGAAKRKR